MFFTLLKWTHFQTMLVSLFITTFKATIAGRMQIIASGAHRTKHNEFLQKYESLLSKTLQFYALRLFAKLSYLPLENGQLEL